MGKGGGVPCPHRERWHCVRVGFGTLECAAPVAPAMPNVSVNWGRFIGSGAEALRSAVEPRLCETAERAEAGRQRPLTPGGGEGGRLVGRIRQGTPSGEIRHSSSPPPPPAKKLEVLRLRFAPTCARGETPLRMTTSGGASAQFGLKPSTTFEQRASPRWRRRLRELRWLSCSGNRMGNRAGSTGCTRRDAGGCGARSRAVP